MRPEHQQPLSIERVCTSARLDSLREPWTDLESEIQDASIFVTWEWVNTWWHTAEQAGELWVLTAWDEAGRLVGLVPWMLVEQNTGPLRARKIRFMGSRFIYCVHLDVVARPCQKPMVCSAFVEYLCANRQEWDIVELIGLASNSVLRSELALADGNHLHREELVCPYILLADDWDTYRKSLKKKLQRNLRYFRRLLDREHPQQAHFHRVMSAHELRTAMDSLAAMNRRRWHAEGITSSFDDDHFVRFHHALATLALERGWLRFYELRIADRTIAALYCLCHKDKYYAYQLGFDLEWARYSPGRQLIGYAIRSAIKEGAYEFDWLSGTHSYKFEWTDRTRSDYHLLWSTNWRGHIELLGASTFDKARAWAREHVPDHSRQRFNRFVSRRRC